MRSSYNLFFSQKSDTEKARKYIYFIKSGFDRCEATVQSGFSLVDAELQMTPGKYTPQYTWLEAELPKVKRSETPWLIVLLHSPWYNSYNYHYMEGETMRVMYESWFIKYKVDVVFAGHVHAYERSERISNIQYNITNGMCTPVLDQSAPVYVTIGDGGNIEGLATNMTEPQPKYSAYREASFGHAVFDIKNRTHAYFSWHRNQDGEAVAADSTWFYNRYWNPVDESKASPS